MPIEEGVQRMNDTNTVGDRPMEKTSGDLERQTLNSGGTPNAESTTQRGQQARNAGALAQAEGAGVCTTCDGTGWTSHATKGMTRCHETKGLPHAN